MKVREDVFMKINKLLIIWNTNKLIYSNSEVWNIKVRECYKIEM